jgi:hypothetical protein
MKPIPYRNSLIMKKIISSLLLICMLSNTALADCDFSTGITPGPNHTYIYTEECHLQVGKLIQQNTTYSLQIADLTKAIDLKDLALTKSDQRTQLWMTTSDQLTDRMTKIESEQKHNEWLYFGLGVLTTFAAGYVAAQALRH